MSRRKSSFSFGVMVTLITRGLQSILGFCSTLILARMFGVMGVGFYMYLSTFIGFAVSIGDCGVLRANIYAVARDSDITRQMIKLSLLVTFLVGGVALLLSVQGFLFEAFENSLRIWVVFLIIIMLTYAYLRGILLGEQRFLAYNLIDLLHSGAFLVSILIVAYFITCNDNRRILIAYASGIIIAFCTILYCLRRDLSFGFPSREAIKNLKIGGRGYLLSIIGFLLVRSDIFLIRYYLNSDSVGLYGIPVAIAEVIWIFPSVIGRILFPKIANTREVVNQAMITESIVRLITIISLVEVVLLALTGKWLLNIFRPEFVKSYIPLLVLLPGIFTMSLSQPIGSYFAGKGYPPIVIYAAGVSFLVNFVLNICLIPYWGITGASFSTSIAYTLHLIIIICAFCRIAHSNLINLFVIKKEDIINFFYTLVKLLKGITHPS